MNTIQSISTLVTLGSVLLPAVLAQAAPVQTGPAQPASVMTEAPFANPIQAASASALPASLGHHRLPIHSGPADGDQEYGTWAGGSRYKVSFHGDMTFVPYLGADYPQNQPLTWRTTSATVGGVELLDGPAARSHSDYRFEYRFGDITEAYDVHSDGVEQTFVVTRLPAAGDLVVTGAIDTDLWTNAVLPAHQELTFYDDRGDAITSYGAAFAFDAAGRRIPLTTGFEAGQITLRVPGAWLADAMLPVVVDPLLANVQVATGGDLGVVDIARDDVAVANNVLFAYVRYASRIDGDAFGRLANDDYSGSTLVFVDNSSTWSTSHVSCAFVGGSASWVIAMARYFGNAATPYAGVRCHARASGDLVQSSNYEVLPRPAGVSDWRPDVGGIESYRSGDDALVVFQSDDNGGAPFANTSTSKVRGVLFTPALGPDGAFGAPFVIREDPALDCERPSVNQVAEGGAGSSWVCVMQAYNNTINGDDWDVYGKRVGSDGTVALGSFYSDFHVQNDRHQLQPVVEGNDGRYAVLFAATPLALTPGKTASPLGHELWLERFKWNQGAAVPAIGGNRAPQLIATNANRRWQATGLGYDTRDDSHWVATYRSDVNQGLGWAYCTRVGFNGAPTEPNVSVFTSQSEYASVIACVYDNDHQDFLMAYGSSAPTAPLFGRTLEYAAVASDSTSGQGCSNASISWIGNQQIGSEFNYLSIQNATPVGHFVVVALAPHDLPIVHPDVTPGCRLLVDAFGPSYLATLPFQFGTQATYTVALPEWLDPMTLYFQDWLFDGNVLEASQRLAVPIVK
ncbi:MAG: hypothetical protein NXI31_20585 [bacterium]|nr:hypothetical protein [bacterium]